MEESEMTEYRLMLYRAWLFLDAWESILAINNIQSLMATPDCPEELHLTPEVYGQMRQSGFLTSYAQVIDAVLDFAVMRFGKMELGYFPFIWKMTGNYVKTPIRRAMLFAAVDMFADIVITRIMALPAAFLLFMHKAGRLECFTSHSWMMQAPLCIAVPVGLYVSVYFVERFGVRAMAAGHFIGFVVYLVLYALVIQGTIKLNNARCTLGDYASILPGNIGELVVQSVEDVAVIMKYPKDRIFVLRVPGAYTNYETVFFARAIVLTPSVVNLLYHNQVAAMIAHECSQYRYCTPYLTHIEKTLSVMAMGYCWKFAYGNSDLIRFFELDPEAHPVIPVYCTLYFIYPLFRKVFEGIRNAARSRFTYWADEYVCWKFHGNNDLGSALLKLLPTRIPATITYENRYSQSEWYSAWFNGQPPPINRIPPLANC